MRAYRDFHRRSIDERETFWSDEAHLIGWKEPFGHVLDYSRPPFSRWFVGGTLNAFDHAG